MINLLCGYPDANVCRYPTNSDIITLLLLAIYYKFVTTNLLNNYIIHIVSKHIAIYISKLISYYPKPVSG